MEITPIMNFVAFIACIVASICAIISIILSIYVAIELKAQQKSTHNIEYMPVDPNWASSDKEVNEFNEKNRILDEEPELVEDQLNRIDLKNLI